MSATIAVTPRQLARRADKLKAATDKLATTSWSARLREAQQYLETICPDPDEPGWVETHQLAGYKLCVEVRQDTAWAKAGL